MVDFEAELGVDEVLAVSKWEASCGFLTNSLLRVLIKSQRNVICFYSSIHVWAVLFVKGVVFRVD